MWETAYTDLDAAIVTWQMNKANPEFIGIFFDFLSEHVLTVLVVGLIGQFLGGIFIFLGIYQRLGAFILIVYLLSSSLIYFPFWLYQGEQASYMFVSVLKNIAIIGGLLFLFGKRVESPSVYDLVDEV